VYRSPRSRIEWCVERVGVRGGHRVLEIGCGHGVAASLVCAAITDGHLVAIDRSAKMIEAAARRNAPHVAAGTASFHVARFAPNQPGLDTGQFDRIFAIHVPVFLRGDPASELTLARRLLAPGGRLCLPFQPLDPASTEGMITKISTDLAAHGFTVLDTVVDEIPSGRVGSVTATATG
jgi:ubiquinone/menaquinone biosynthesis C-methylase UbiE